MVKRGWGGVRIGREVRDGRGKAALLKRQNRETPINSITLGGLPEGEQGLRLRAGCLVLAEGMRLLLQEHLLWVGSHH